jgi:hypothetical protein
MGQDTKKLSTAPLNWNEVWYTNCPVVSARNVDEALGWIREEFKKIGVKYAYFRSVQANDWYPHYIHNLDNLIRVGGLFPPVHVHADIRRTRLLGATHVYEGGCMMVRARDDIHRMSDLKGRKIGLSKSLNTGMTCPSAGKRAGTGRSPFAFDRAKKKAQAGMTEQVAG